MSTTAFRYEAARADGVAVRGVLEAASGSDAAAVLSGRGLYPLSVEPATASRGIWTRRPSARAQAILFQSLASLVDAGVPIEKAIRVTARVVAGPLREALARVGEKVSEGASLGTALASEQRLCSGVTIGLVRAGERGMGLAAALAQAATQLEREAETAARIRGALAYPALLAVVGTLSVGVIVIVVVPRFVTLLSDLDQALPMATRVLIGVSTAVRRFGLPLAATSVMAAAWFVRFTSARRPAWHAWLLTLPLIGAIRHAFATARACRALGALLGTGAPALAALAVAQQAAGDAGVAERLGRSRDQVSEGAPLSAALSASDALTDTAIQLVAIGEGSGRLPALLAKAADIEEREAERTLGTLVTFLEPALILAFAAVVAFVAAALLQAVYSLRPGGV